MHAAACGAFELLKRTKTALSTGREFDSIRLMWYVFGIFGNVQLLYRPFEATSA